MVSEDSARTAVSNAISLDGYLSPYANIIHARHVHLLGMLKHIDETEGGLEAFSRGYEQRGFQVLPDQTIVYREWAPGAITANLIGDFSNFSHFFCVDGWNRESHPMQRDQWGCWEIKLPPIDGKPAIPHDTRVKITMKTERMGHIDRIPAWIKRAVQQPDTGLFEGHFWNPPQPYQWQHARSSGKTGLRIYECHVGICTPDGRIASYDDLRGLLPYIHRLGYNCIQLMAVMEHAYYASFGYQVTSFFAASSRFGTPDQLKALIDAAHGLGMRVLLDVVHSHASKNSLDGLNLFDGTDHCYFHGGGKGLHTLWDSRLFDYHHHETLRFLLSNLRFWLEEYRFDGFRFDGVTSMLYHHHGMAYCFTNYDDYYGPCVDGDALCYLQLANLMVHQVLPDCITIAEDVSGMPLLCRPVLQEAGIGFDYRLAMAIPDLWIKILKEVHRDEDWNLGHLCHTLCDRRWKEPTVAYVESHDQALVGDKTVAFWLMDAEMYTNMSLTQTLSPCIDRGIALHKLIRLLTFGLGGEAYMTFMGNEFGHPEWLDFPRAGNNNSFHYARRQYNLAQDPLLRYQHLLNWDRAMLYLDIHHDALSAPPAYISLKHELDKVIVFERSPNLIWIFNLHPWQSLVDYRIGCQTPGCYRILLNSDDPRWFGGHGRIDEVATLLFTEAGEYAGREHSMKLYLPCRTALVLLRVDSPDSLPHTQLQSYLNQ